MADVKWIKITTDIFDDEKLLLIESLPSADSIITIWFKLLVLSGKQNNNGVFMMSNKMPYTDEMLSAIFRRDVNTVRLALNTFEEFGMIEIVDNVITIPNWGKHQTLDAYEKKKERDRLYQQERRNKQKALICKESSDESSDESIDVAVSEEERDKEEDKERDIVEQGSDEKIPFKEIVDYLNEKSGFNYRYNAVNTKKHISARFKENFTLEDFCTVIDYKVSEWKKDEKMRQYLRPDTLFGTKFESYLNNAPKKKSAKPIEEPAEQGWEEELIGDDWMNV